MVFEAFWFYEVKTSKAVSPAHIINWSHHEENEAGCEGDVYTAYCGEEMSSWGYNTPIQSDFGTLERAITLGANVCEKCSKSKSLTG